MSEICDPTVRRTIVHDGGHEFPRDIDLIKAVHVIRRTVSA